MKRFLAILLALIMVLALCACGADKGNDAQNNNDNTANNPPADENNDNNANDADTTDDGADKQDITSSSSSTIGFMTDEVDHFARDAYKVAYMCNDLSWVWNRAICDNLKKLGEFFNYELYEYECRSDFDAYINQIYVYDGQDFNGVVLGTDDALVVRAFEVCQELDLPAMAESTPFVDSEGVIVGASVSQDQYGNGAECMRWLADNYKTYWGEDIDTSKIGLIPITFSRVTGINDRVPGMTDVFKECFPESADNIYIEDLVQTSFSVDGAYEQISTRLVATQEIEHWFIIAAVDDWATGALRATEAIDAVDKVLITCCQGNAFVNEMKTGYSGDCWVSCCYVPEKEFSEYMAAGLVALMDGRATVETLWPDAIAEGDKAPNMQVRGTMVTRDTLDDFLASQVISF